MPSHPLDARGRARFRTRPGRGCSLLGQAPVKPGGSLVQPPGTLVGGIRAALGAETPAPKPAAAADTTRAGDRPKPGEQTVERTAKRMEFADGWVVSFGCLGSAETGAASPEKLCLCPVVEVQSAGKFSPTCCHCSVGYVRETHERMLGRPVQVELVDSVLRGGKRCRFRMTVA